MKKKKESENVDDVVFEETEIGEGEAFSKDKIKALREKLKDSDAKAAEYLTDLQRAKADFVNLRKRDGEMMGKRSVMAQEELITRLLPALDSFKMAMDHETWESVDKEWQTGMEAIYGQIYNTLNESGLELIDPQGEDFDPNLHEAVGVEKAPSTSSGQADTILKVVQPGYKLHDTVIRTAKVVVGE